MLRLTICSAFTVFLILSLFALASAAPAGQENPGQAVAAAGGGAQMQEPVFTTLNLPCCPVCTKLGHTCPNCTRMMLPTLSEMASSACGDCTPDALCERCCMAVDGTLAKLPTLEAGTLNGPEFQLAYLAGKFGGDRGALIMSAADALASQNLLSADSVMCSIYPDLLVKGVSPDTDVYSGSFLAPGMTPKPPLKTFTIPAGLYLRVTHNGDYEMLGATWMAAFAYCQAHNLQLGSGPCGEEYRSDPMSTPADQQLAYIYLPLAAAP